MTGDFRRTFSVPRLWIILSVGTAVMFTALLALGCTHISKRRRSLPSRCVRRPAKSSTPVTTSRRASRSGSRSAGCSKGRSGGTADTSRRTGPQIGCTGKRMLFLRPFRQTGACKRDGRDERRPAQGRAQHGDAQKHIRSHKRRHHHQRQPRTRDRPGREAFQRAMKVAVKRP